MLVADLEDHGGDPVALADDVHGPRPVQRPHARLQRLAPQPVVQHRPGHGGPVVGQAAAGPRQLQRLAETVRA